MNEVILHTKNNLFAFEIRIVSMKPANLLGSKLPENQEQNAGNLTI